MTPHLVTRVALDFLNLENSANFIVSKSKINVYLVQKRESPYSPCLKDIETYRRFFWLREWTGTLSRSSLIFDLLQNWWYLRRWLYGPSNLCKENVD